MPYFVLGADMQVTEKLAVTTSIALSPYVIAKDEDHHLLREYGGKVVKGDMDGTGVMFDISGKYNFTTIWFGEFGFHATKIDVDGTMHQSYVLDNYYIGSNKVEAESTQTSGYLTIGANL
jgi:hypothetical protein